MINLTEGGAFDEMDLVRHIQNSGRQYIIQGQQTATHDNHTKPSSLDYWLRLYAINPNTKQADNLVIYTLINTGLFEVVARLQCPDSGEMCKGIQLIA